MSSDKLDFPIVKEYRIERTVSQLSSIIPRVSKLQAKVGSERSPSRNVEVASRGLSLDNVQKLMDHMRITATRIEDPWQLDMYRAEVRACKLLAQANKSESAFELGGVVKHLDEAIEYRRQAVSLSADSHAAKPNRLDKLGIAYLSRFERLGEVFDVNKAIECLHQAVLLAAEGHQDRPVFLINLGLSYRRRFERLGELEDVAKAIKCLSQAVLLCPDGHSQKAGSLINLGCAYQARFDRLGELADQDRAIDCQSQALRLIPDGHKHKPTCLDNLGSSYQTRFQHFGELTDISKAIEYQSQAVLLTPDSDPEKHICLNNLGNSYLSRFQRFGELADVDKAIEYQSQAVLLTPEEHPNKPRWLGNLGTSYRIRFLRLEEPEDINNAIKHHRQALQLIPNDHVYKLTCLLNLGNSYHTRFERSGKLTDLDQAIKCKGQAALLLPDNHADKPIWLNNLGNSYTSRFERLRELADVDSAIQYQSWALRLTPDRHADTPGLLNNLGTSYSYRFDLLGEPADEDKAIEILNQVMTLTPDGHARKPGRAYNFGKLYVSRFERLGAVQNLESARAIFEHAAQLIIIDPAAQMRCARHWAKCLAQLGLSPQPAYERCMELIPHLVWLGTTVDQRYMILTKIRDLATEAAAWAISVQSYDLAVEWLEEGRSVVWSQLLQLRAPFDNLSDVAPLLAQRLKSIASQLEGVGSRPTTETSLPNTTMNLEKDAQDHRRLATEWNHLLREARNIPGFDSFMRPRRADELKLAAVDGPVVLINAHSSRADALIIFPQCDDIAHIPLDCCSLEKMIKAREQLHSLVENQRDRGGGFKRSNPEPKPEDVFKSILANLWSDVVRPVLEALGCRESTPIDDMPHVTWCTTGVLSFLPLHAAGLYNDSGQNIFDLVVSSYTPTLNALLASRASAPNLDHGVLAVSQEHTPGFSSLPSTLEELTVVKLYTETTCFHQLDGGHATVDAVLNAMERHSWVHLACHATQNRHNPSHSAFHLFDGPLTLENITKRAFMNKGLAFLSACQTATGDDRLADEAIHLAAGMLMAGYPSVIATTWSIYDEDAPEVARGVYAELLKDGQMDSRQSARALHKAAAGLRERFGKDTKKRRAAEREAEGEDVEMEDGTVKESPKKKKKQGVVKVGAEFKAKNAGGDVKKPGQQDPYAYLPLGSLGKKKGRPGPRISITGRK